jgi:chromosome segregation ATPase
MAQGLEGVRGEMAQGLEGVRGEMAQGLESVRGEMAQGLESVRGEMAQGLENARGEMAQGFDSLRQEFKAEMKHVSNAAYEHYLRIETERRADVAEYRSERRQLLTAMDTSAKNYENFKENRERFDGKIHELQSEVKELKKRDMEKAAAIERIEKQLKAA